MTVCSRVRRDLIRITALKVGNHAPRLEENSLQHERQAKSSSISATNLSARIRNFHIMKPLVNRFVGQRLSLFDH
jgi:hypothetical protein